MQEEFILSQVRRCNRNSLLINLLVFLAVAFIVLFSYNYFYNFLLGPFDLNATSLTEIRDPNNQEKNYITVRGADVVHTGLQNVETLYEEDPYEVISTKATSDYVYLSLVNNKLLLIQTDPEAFELTYSGMLREIPADVKQELISLAVEEDVSPAEFDQVVLPLMLDTQIKTSRAGGYIGLGTLVLLAVFSVWNLFRYTQRIANPFGHPIYNSLELYGDPVSVAKDIDEDIASSGFPIAKKIIVSDAWLVRKKLFGLTLVPLENVLWMYKHTTKQSIDFIPVGRTHSLALHQTNRVVLHINMREKNVDALAEVIHSRAPGIINEYSGELEVLWNKSYSAFAAEIENLKSEV